MAVAASKNITTVEEHGYIFERYLDICNQALEKNKDKFPYSEIWKARWDHLGANNNVECTIYENRPKIIYRLQLMRTMKHEIIKKTRVAPDESWPFRHRFLKHVVDHPQDYIDHPANLDWSWLTGTL